MTVCLCLERARGRLVREDDVEPMRLELSDQRLDRCRPANDVGRLGVADRGFKKLESHQLGNRVGDSDIESQGAAPRALSHRAH